MSVGWNGKKYEGAKAARLWKSAVTTPWKIRCEGEKRTTKDEVAIESTLHFNGRFIVNGKHRRYLIYVMVSKSIKCHINCVSFVNVCLSGIKES